VGIVDRTTPDGRFSFAEAGGRRDPAIVFLHGIGGAARAWRAQLAHFGGAARAVAWDMPGYGGSAPLAEASIAELAEALVRFLAQIGAEPPALVGHSIGGMIVQQLIATRPGAARAVVLAQTSPAFGRADGQWQREFIAARLGPLDRGETMASLAPRLVAELVATTPIRRVRRSPANAWPRCRRRAIAP
jgi:3-oxoadipate enol-lactonase